jgi:serine/threonine protein kinase
MSVANPLFSSEVMESLCNRFPENVDFFQQSDCNIERDNLQIHESIAKGAFGTVHKGEYNGKKVAVKIQNVPVTIREECTNVLVELSLMQSMPHERLVSYIGADCRVIDSETTEVCYNNINYFNSTFDRLLS